MTTQPARGERHSSKPEDGLHADLGTFLDPESVAIVGASARNDVAHGLIANMLRDGCQVWGVHPSGKPVGGTAVAAEFSQLPFLPDLAVLAVGARSVLEATRTALEAGVRNFVIPGLGPEDGALGHEVRAALLPMLDEAGAAVVGPNCMGVLVPRGSSAWLGSVPGSIRPGSVGVLVQSGSVGEVLTGIGPRVGFRAVVSSGNELTRDAADWLAFYARDEQTRVIGMFLEAVRRPAAFEAALAEASRAEKPVIVVKVGRSDEAARLSQAHSGAIVGSDLAFDALCRTYGVLRCDDVSDWVEALELVGSSRTPPGRNLVVITNSGGEGSLVADHAASVGMSLPPLGQPLRKRILSEWPFGDVHNPIDYYAVAEESDILPSLVDSAVADESVDGVLLNIDQSHRFENGEADTCRFAAEVAVAAAQSSDSFIAIMSSGTADPDDDVVLRCAEVGVPVLIGAGRALRAISAYAAWKPRVRTVPADVAPDALARTRARLARDGAMSEVDSKAALAPYGLTAPREQVAATPDEAASIAASIGYPVVVKAHGPAHKERVGGVHLGCATEERVREVARRHGGPVLVADDIRGGTEVMCGAVRDQTFGPVVVCGVGGGWAEAMSESVQGALAPLSHADAEELVRACVPLARRLSPEGVAGVAAVLAGLGQVMSQHPEISEIDVNPLLVDSERAVALDALIVVDRKKNESPVPATSER